MSLALAQACRVVSRVAQVERRQIEASKTSFMFSKEVVQEILSWLTVHLGGTTGDWNTERLAKTSPRKNDCHTSVDGGGESTFCNTGLLRWEQARAQWRVKRNPPPPRPPKIPYHTLVNALASSNNGNFVLPGCMMLEEVVSLLVDIW